MKRQIVMLVGLLLIVIALLAGGKLAAQEPAPPAPQDHREDVVCGGLNRPNLLQNPSFEGDYSAYAPPGGHQDCPSGVCQTAQMADAWTPYWLSPHDTDNPDIHNPEYKPAEEGLDPPRVHHGQRAQQYFTAFSTHEAGFYQQVSVTPGQIYCFGIWGHVWSTDTNDPFFSEGFMEQRIGIDSTGGTDWQSDDIIWGGGRRYRIDIPNGVTNAYGPFTLVARAEASYITVFTKARPDWPVRNNNAYWDEAILFQAPVEPAMNLSTNSFAMRELPPEAKTYNLDVDVSFEQDPGVIWRASVNPGATLDVTLWPMVGAGAAGTGNDDLTISFNSTAYGPGAYEATMSVVSEPQVAGSPATVTVRLLIFEEFHDVYAPLVVR